MFEPLRTITTEGLKAASKIYRQEIYIIINGEYLIYKPEENKDNEKEVIE